MEDDRNGNDGYGLVFFKPGTSPGEKSKGLFFFTVLTFIILGQACYWIFANSVEPIILGMPFGMFTVVMFIVLEFIALVVMYALESETRTGKGEDQ
ncbi:MAG: hypothetical protein MI799_01075 [Desulfobacterales bacterium]|nr:hypothetical protein [Desulfobacterales bacterium]